MKWWCRPDLLCKTCRSVPWEFYISGGFSLSSFNPVCLLQVELVRSKRGTRFYRGEPDRRPSRRTLVVVHVQKSPSSFAPSSCEPHHTPASTNTHHHSLSINSLLSIMSFLSLFPVFMIMVFFCYLIQSNSLFSVWVNLCVCACVCVFVCVSLAHCVDSKTSAVRVYGDTWLRWRGPRVEYCRCALRGRELCHIVPVMSEWDAQTHLDPLTRVTSTWLIFTHKHALDL